MHTCIDLCSYYMHIFLCMYACMYLFVLILYTYVSMHVCMHPLQTTMMKESMHIYTHAFEILTLINVCMYVWQGTSKSHSHVNLSMHVYTHPLEILTLINVCMYVRQDASKWHSCRWPSQGRSLKRTAQNVPPWFLIMPIWRMTEADPHLHVLPFS